MNEGDIYFFELWGKKKIEVSKKFDFGILKSKISLAGVQVKQVYYIFI